MNICLCSFLMQWFELLVGKLLVMPYQKGWMIVPGNDPSRTFADLYTKDTFRMAVITSFWDCPLLIIGMFLIFHYIVCAILSLVVLTVERSFATYLLNDYETKTRPQIHRILLVAQQIIGALISLLSCTVMIPVEAWLILIVLVMALTFAGYTYIWYWNVRVHKIMDSRHIFSCTKYSLQARFQAKENARSLSFARTVFSFATICISFQAIILAVQTPELLGSLAVPFFYLMELTTTVNPISCVPLILLNVPSWRKKLFNGCATIRLIKWLLAKRTPEVGFVKPRSDSREWGDILSWRLRKMSYSLKYINPRQGKVLPALQAHVNSLWPNLPLIKFEIDFYRGFCPSLIDSKVRDIRFAFSNMNKSMLESILTSHSNLERVSIAGQFNGTLGADSKLMRVPSVSCNVVNNSSLTEDLLEHFKGNRLILDMASTCEQAVSQLIKDWMIDAKYPNLKTLIVHLKHGAHPFKNITKNLNGVKWDKYRWPTEEELGTNHDILGLFDWEKSYDIRQKDTGKMATVNCKHNAVIFFVRDCQNQ
ncbi:hypothetical protein GCK72_003732 [Caenorhabditis remanei]|uniref:Uncharacterized protein n=1 Tax=Caenorhabditis remanei TaxID=31234 RepID=A0A6A5H976_CAERE|nr:hypothetical protein GCK72_003732 [Caenorhabditis remanei]KAF1763787.1 hypothetical protein GCK72_003732 [Caenorhabditis remanei]